MKLKNGEIRPGKVIAVVDEYGTVKASCCGYFSEEDDPDMLPPVYPFLQTSASSFNQPKVGDLIWVMVFSDNMQELFYVFQGNTKVSSGHILGGKPKDSQVLASRDYGFSKSQLYWSSEDGWNMENDASKISIDKDMNIDISRGDMSHRSISVSEDSISLGTFGKSAEPAVLGDRLVDSLNKLYFTLCSIKEAASASPYTTQIGSMMSEPLDSFKSSIDSVRSKNVTLD